MGPTGSPRGEPVEARKAGGVSCVPPRGGAAGCAGGSGWLLFRRRRSARAYLVSLTPEVDGAADAGEAQADAEGDIPWAVPKSHGMRAGGEFDRQPAPPRERGPVAADGGAAAAGALFCYG